LQRFCSQPETARSAARYALSGGVLGPRFGVATRWPHASPLRVSSACSNAGGGVETRSRACGRCATQARAWTSGASGVGVPDLAHDRVTWTRLVSGAIEIKAAAAAGVWCPAAAATRPPGAARTPPHPSARIRGPADGGGVDWSGTRAGLRALRRPPLLPKRFQRRSDLNHGRRRGRAKPC
jgi:hypothetical protein